MIVSILFVYTRFANLPLSVTVCLLHIAGCICVFCVLPKLLMSLVVPYIICCVPCTRNHVCSIFKTMFGWMCARRTYEIKTNYAASHSQALPGFCSIQTTKKLYYKIWERAEEMTIDSPTSVCGFIRLTNYQDVRVTSTIDLSQLEV